MGLTIIEDTRQKDGKHTLKNDQWMEQGVAVIRSAIRFGDYVIDSDDELPPIVSVDTKADIYELAKNIGKEHDRFRRELVGARDIGTQLVVLVENEDGVESLEDLCEWRESEGHFAMRKRVSKNENTRIIEGRRLAKACKTMEQRYGVRFEFCRPDEAAARVVKILLEGGERRCQK